MIVSVMRQIRAVGSWVNSPSRPLKNLGEAGKTRRKQPKKRSLRAVNEHFEAVFNAVLPTQVVFNSLLTGWHAPCQGLDRLVMIRTLPEAAYPVPRQYC
ncbi:hypothetical protein FVE88_11215 [Ectopseudomonas mendocina]|nr:hypothetical protein FVE88_11215 [Pseudomonas mendocina]